MEELELEKNQRYFDVDTGTPLHIYLKQHEINVGGVNVYLDGVPLLINENTGHIHLPNKTKEMIAFFVSKAIEQGQSGIELSPKELGKKRYKFAEKFNYKYSEIDYGYIPGLIRPWDEGFLTPVFFKPSVLNKYSQHPEYKLNLFSETYGNIETGEWIIAFGLNRNKKVIMWLGDIDGLPEDEKYYLRSENVSSDHDIHSEFYDAQIDVTPSERSRKNHLFHVRSELNNLVSMAHGHPLFVLDGEVSNIIENLDRPVFWEAKHVSPVIEALNRVFVESINVKKLKASIKAVDPEVDVKSKASLKVCQLWLQKCLSSTQHSELMSSFYVLNDYRVLLCHLLPDEKRKDMLAFINKRLSMDEENVDNELIFDRLIDELIESNNQIMRLINC